MPNEITQQELKEVLDYNPVTGSFVWRERGIKYFSSERLCDRWNKAYAGRLAGHLDRTGYSVINISGTAYRAHRLAWLYVHGFHPTVIDHIDHRRSNNRISNLRDASSQENNRNRLMHKNNTSGVMGVRWDKSDNAWRSQIMVDSKNIHLYSGNDFFEACCARKSAIRKYGFSKNHGSVGQDLTIEN